MGCLNLQGFSVPLLIFSEKKRDGDSFVALPYLMSPGVRTHDLNSGLV